MWFIYTCIFNRNHKLWTLNEINKKDNCFFIHFCEIYFVPNLQMTPVSRSCFSSIFFFDLKNCNVNNVKIKTCFPNMANKCRCCKIQIVQIPESVKNNASGDRERVRRFKIVWKSVTPNGVSLSLSKIKILILISPEQCLFFRPLSWNNQRC